jgi:hypothetical protein
VTATLRTLIARAIDYAGLFPPARLPMGAAVAEYLRVRSEPEAWMLARFVCPAARLAELAERWPAPEGPPLAVVALGSTAASLAELAECSRADAAAIRAFAAAAARRAVVDQVEVRLPADLLAGRDADEIRQAISDLHGALSPSAAAELLLAVEAPVAGAPPARVAAVAAGIDRWNRIAVPAGHLPVCLKVRCGGLDAAAVPTVAELAGALAAGRDRNVAIKATQGLHHPLRRFDHELGTSTHGFLNLMTAAVLARACRLDESKIGAILADTEPAHFGFTDDGLAWGRHEATLADVAAGRRHALVSFGSCSFDEPRTDLAALGLLEA